VPPALSVIRKLFDRSQITKLGPAARKSDLIATGKWCAGEDLNP
jgi:hypothetical protein